VPFGVIIGSHPDTVWLLIIPAGGVVGDSASRTNRRQYVMSFSLPPFDRRPLYLVEAVGAKRQRQIVPEKSSMYYSSGSSLREPSGRACLSSLERFAHAVHCFAHQPIQKRLSLLEWQGLGTQDVR